MKAKTVLPVITFIVAIGSFGLSFFDVYEITELEIKFLLSIMGTFGMGGIYIKAIKEGFNKYREIKESQPKDT